jgi:hypothetical protein
MSLDKKTAPDGLLTSAAIKKVVASRLASLSGGKRVSCSYSLFVSLMGACQALEVGEAGFPGVTKATAAKRVTQAEARYKELLAEVQKLDKEKRDAYNKELASLRVANDLKLLQTALAKKKYSEAYTAALSFGWTMESVTIQLYKFQGKRSPVTAAMVAERKKLYEQAIADLQRRHQVRGADEAYLLRYSVYARNLRNMQETVASSAFVLLQTDEQLGMYDIALDIISLIDQGSKAKI